MKNVFTLVTLAAFVAFSAGAFAQASTAAATKTLTPQQQKMSDCAKANKGKKGSDYKSAMSTCLSASDAAPAAPMTQQEKMSACAKANKGKTGDDYRNGVKSCLSAS